MNNFSTLTTTGSFISYTSANTLWRKKEPNFDSLHCNLPEYSLLWFKGNICFFFLYFFPECNAQAHPRTITKLCMVFKVRLMFTVWKFEARSLFLIEDIKVWNKVTLGRNKIEYKVTYRRQNHHLESPNKRPPPVHFSVISEKTPLLRNREQTVRPLTSLLTSVNKLL